MATKLTEHFTLEEFLHTDTGGLQDDNINTFKSYYGDTGIVRLTILSQLLEKFRAVLKRPIVITSGYRCPVLNSRVNGSKSSAHMSCYAADFVCSYGDFIRLCAFVDKYEKDFDQFICYKNRGFAHISIAPRNRRQIFSK